VGVMTALVWSGVVAAIAFKLIDLVIGLRVPEEAEREGSTPFRTASARTTDFEGVCEGGRFLSGRLLPLAGALAPLFFALIP